MSVDQFYSVGNKAVKQVTERGHSVYDVADRLGISVKSLYDWRAKYGQDKTNQSSDEQLRIAKLEAELKRVKEERDILKKAAKYESVQYSVSAKFS